MKTTKIILTLFSIATLISCGSKAPVEGKLDSTMKIGEMDVIVKAYTSSILSNDKKQTSIVAPEGKTYMVVSVESTNDNYFPKVTENGKEIEKVDYSYTMDFIEKTDKIKTNVYLIDESNKTELKFEIKDYGNNKGSIKLEGLADKTDRTANEKMLAFVNEYKSPINLLDGIKKYTGKDVYDIVKERGEEVPTSPMTKNLKIEYVSKDGSYYKCRGESLSSILLETWWENNEITKAIFQQ